MPLFSMDEIMAEGERCSQDYDGQECYTLDDEFDIFLSYRYLDRRAVWGLKSLLEKSRFTVYVDVEDDLIDRQEISKATADWLRKMMDRCKCLLYTATINAPDSRWMPWELGYFDGRTSGKVGILPVTLIGQVSNDFRGQEYLGLYPFVMKKPSNSSGGHELFIGENESTSVRLREWLSGQETPSHTSSQSPSSVRSNNRTVAKSPGQGGAATPGDPPLALSVFQAVLKGAVVSGLDALFQGLGSPTKSQPKSAEFDNGKGNTGSK